MSIDQLIEEVKIISSRVYELSKCVAMLETSVADLEKGTIAVYFEKAYTSEFQERLTDVERRLHLR